MGDEDSGGVTTRPDDDRFAARLRGVWPIGILALARAAIAAGASSWFALIHRPIRRLPGVGHPVIAGLAFGTIVSATNGGAP